MSRALSHFFDEQRRSQVSGEPVLGFSARHVKWVEDDETPQGHTVLFWLQEPDDFGPFSFGDANFYVSANAGATESRCWTRF